MSEETKSALTAEEWATGPRVLHRGSLVLARVEGTVTVRCGHDLVSCAGADLPVLAALCLYQQPFGFTAEDAAALLDTASKMEAEIAAGGPREALLSRLMGPRIVRL